MLFLLHDEISINEVSGLCSKNDRRVDRLPIHLDRLDIPLVRRVTTAQRLGLVSHLDIQPVSVL
jgi:hypothetical protein